MELGSRLVAKAYLTEFDRQHYSFLAHAWAEQSVPSAEVGILMALMPIATLLLAHWLLEHEPLTGGVSGCRRRLCRRGFISG